MTENIFEARSQYVAMDIFPSHDSRMTSRKFSENAPGLADEGKATGQTCRQPGGIAKVPLDHAGQDRETPANQSGLGLPDRAPHRHLYKHAFAVRSRPGRQARNSRDLPGFRSPYHPVRGQVKAPESGAVGEKRAVIGGVNK